MNAFQQFWDCFLQVTDVVNAIRVVFGLSSIYGIYSFVMNWVPKTISLSIGTFKIKRKDFDVQNLTNVVSANFFNGGQIPPEIRREIIEKTCPKIKIIKED